MNIPKIIIAIDGYSSTGKSSFAKLIANEFSFLYLDSGALYRAVTLFAQEEGLIDESSHIDLEGLKQALKTLKLRFVSEGGVNRTYMGERCVEKEIRSMKVSSQVSPISAVAFVRNFVDENLHDFAKDGGVVMDGRDIGTTVFPDAQVKIFLTASPKVRARRRYEEMLAKGESLSLEEIEKNLENRDYIDSHRESSPLSRAADAFVLDNSEMTLAEELIWVKGLIQGKLGILE